MPVTPAIEEAESRRIKVEANQGKKLEISISTNKLGVVVHMYNPNCGRHR
jgi:hypothetical protein